MTHTSRWICSRSPMSRSVASTISWIFMVRSHSGTESTSLSAMSVVRHIHATQSSQMTVSLDHGMRLGSLEKDIATSVRSAATMTNGKS